METVSLDYIQANKHILDIVCKYRLCVHRNTQGNTQTHSIKSESYKAVIDELKNKKNKKSNNIIDEMKNRCNSKFLFGCLKKNNFEFFVPFKCLSHKLYHGENNIVLEICYHHNADVYDIMYDNKQYYNKGNIMVPQGEVKKEMEKLYDLYKINLPFEKHTEQK